MASTVNNSAGKATDSLMRCSQAGFLSNPLSGRELRRQAQRNRKRAAKQLAKN